MWDLSSRCLLFGFPLPCRPSALRLADEVRLRVEERRLGVVARVVRTALVLSVLRYDILVVDEALRENGLMMLVCRGISIAILRTPESMMSFHGPELKLWTPCSRIYVIRGKASFILVGHSFRSKCHDQMKTIEKCKEFAINSMLQC